MYLTHPLEQERLLHGLIRICRVVETNDQGQVKVVDHQLQSPWLSCAQLRGADNISWNPLDKDEQVLVVCPSGDLAQGIVVAALYQNKFALPHHNMQQQSMHFKDGSSVLYDREQHSYVLDVKQDQALIQLHSDDRIALDAQKNVHIQAEQESVQVQAQQQITLQAEQKIEFVVGGSRMTLTPEGISIQADAIKVASQQDMTLTAQGQAQLTSQGEATLKASGDMIVKGATVNIN
tara:strand:- start:1886 stop:2590 length:705 start_codon:yes stop_codon:yes gene_type:complete